MEVFFIKQLDGTFLSHYYINCTGKHSILIFPLEDLASSYINASIGSRLGSRLWKESCTCTSAMPLLSHFFWCFFFFSLCIEKELIVTCSYSIVNFSDHYISERKLPYFWTKEIRNTEYKTTFYVCVILEAFRYFVVISQPNVDTFNNKCND